MHPGGSVHALSKPLCTRRAARRTDRVCDRECEHTVLSSVACSYSWAWANCQSGNSEHADHWRAEYRRKSPSATAYRNECSSQTRSLIQFLIFLRILLTRASRLLHFPCTRTERGDVVSRAPTRRAGGADPTRSSDADLGCRADRSDRK